MGRPKKKSSVGEAKIQLAISDVIAAAAVGSGHLSRASLPRRAGKDTKISAGGRATVRR